ncbi:MAG: hypothetical protein JNJ46_05965 [Myxococcales bacterium]|nr:hypothetical protein [Myxococcales bacterium]
MGRTTLSEPEKTHPASAEPSAPAPDARASNGTTSRPVEPGSDEPMDDRAEEQASRALLSGLSSVSPPRDLAQSVPALIHRRSQGRFFGRKRLADRLPFEWISLIMLLVLAATYAVLKLFFTD